MAIAALVLWVLTAAAGVALLVTGNATRRTAATDTATDTAAAHATGAAATPAAITAAGPATAAAAPPRATRPGGPAAAAPGPIPRVTVHAAPGDHPLLEFSHPVLGLLGLGLWFVYVGTRHRPLAWLSFGVLLLAIVAGLSWLGRTERAARRGGPPAASRFPARLAVLHGCAAAATVTIAVLTALAANH
jgi:hypothetical protein